MERQQERIVVHEGVQLFRESPWFRNSESTGIQVFLLVGLREKEVLSAVQVPHTSIVQEIENFHMIYPMNTKIVGVYISYLVKDLAQFGQITDTVYKQALSQRLVPLANFIVILREQKQSTSSNVVESLECSFWQPSQPNFEEGRAIFHPEIELLDLKREQVLNSFVYFILSIRFEGFNEEFQSRKDEVLKLLENPKNLYLQFKQLGMVQSFQELDEAFGKKLNSEVKKLIKASKEKQDMFTVVNIEMLQLPESDDMNKCPSFSMEHIGQKDLRKLDLNICGLFNTSDTLNESVDTFISHCRKTLSGSFFPQSSTNNLMMGQHNIKESAILVSSMYKFGKNDFYNSIKMTEKGFVQQRQAMVDRLSYGQPSPRFRPGSSIQLFPSTYIDRPLDIHTSLMKKQNFGDAPSQKYVVSGSYLYFHYMQDNFNDNGWGCAYRSLQTLISYFKCEGYAPSIEVPTHREIQRALVDMEDKERDMLESSQWIGAFEVNLCLTHFLGIDCKIMNVTSGAELSTKGKELKEHFIQEGTPVMIGGDLYAYTILGVDYCEENDDVRFLILDPHFPGSDSNVKNILQKGWCGWKDASMFKSDAFYNLCMPLKPKEV